MKEAVRPRNEDPGQRSRDRQHWHEYDEMVKSYRMKFIIHLLLDLLLVAGTAYLAIHLYSERVQGEVKELNREVATVTKDRDRKAELLKAKDKEVIRLKKLLAKGKKTRR